MEMIDIELLLERTETFFLSLSGIPCHFIFIYYFFFLVSRNLVKIPGKFDDFLFVASLKVI